MVVVNYWKNKLISYDIEKFNSFEILHVNVFDSDATNEECNECISIMKKYLKEIELRGKCFHLFYNVENVNKMLPTTYIYNCIKMFKDNKSILEKYLIKTSIINAGTFVISCSKLIFTFYTPVRPHTFVNNLKEAKEKLFKLN